MRVTAVALLLLVSLLFAESQESVYYRALKAEESGNVTESIELFEKAAEVGGPYTEEINEILKEYYQALGIGNSSLSYRFLGDLSFHGIYYEESWDYGNIREYGNEAFWTLSFSLDYSVSNLIHSFVLNYMGNAYVGDKISPMDSVKWMMAPGIEYDLVGTNFVFCANVDLKFNSEDWNPLLYGWFEKIWLRWDRHKLGTAFSLSKEWNGPLIAAMFASWHIYNPRGFNMSLLLGPRLYVEKVFDYDAWLMSTSTAENSTEYNNWNNYNPWENGGQWGNPYGESEQEESADSTWSGDYFPHYNVKWIGPYLRSKFTYKFRYNITTEFKLNLFYGFAADGPSKAYERMNKFTGTWGPTVYGSPNIMTLYTGVENNFRRYFDIPALYQEYLSDKISIWEWKLGVKVNW